MWVVSIVFFCLVPVICRSNKKERKSNNWKEGTKKKREWKQYKETKRNRISSLKISKPMRLFVKKPIEFSFCDNFNNSSEHWLWYFITFKRRYHHHLLLFLSKFSVYNIEYTLLHSIINLGRENKRYMKLCVCCAIYSTPPIFELCSMWFFLSVVLTFFFGLC